MPKKKPIKLSNTLSSEEQRSVEALVEILHESYTEDFIRMLQRPGKLLFFSFLTGVIKGFGAVIGATIVFALAGWIISQLVNFPLIGSYFDRAGQEFNQLKESTNTAPYLRRIESQLIELNKNLSEQK